MNLYAHDLSLLDFNYGISDSISDPLSHRFFSPASSFHGEDDDFRRNVMFDRRVEVNGRESAAKRKIPPTHRHDGKSPLPLGMDWSAPPRKWDGRNTVWPHDPQTGWSYCVTVPSWIRLPTSSVSDSVVFYRVQVGLQSPEGITAARLIPRRFSDFLELYELIKKEFPKKILPHAPPKRILRMKSQALLEERRCFLEDWMSKLLSDIDISRSAPVATFLELEAAVRSYFSDEDQQDEDANPYFAGDIESFLPSIGSSSASIPANSSDHVNDSADGTSGVVTPTHVKDGSKDLVSKNSPSEDNVIDWHELITKYGLLDKNFFHEKEGKVPRTKIDTTTEIGVTNGDEPSGGVTCQNLDGSVRRYSSGAIESDSSLVKDDMASNLGPSNLFSHGSVDHHPNTSGERHNVIEAGIKFQRDLVIAFHTEERQRLNRVIDMMKQRLQTAKTDVEDLLARLNQEFAVRQFLSTKVKDLEVELETTRESCKQRMEQTVLSEKERYTQTQWDMEELRKRCVETELSLNSLMDEKEELETANQSLLQENEMLLREMNHIKEKVENLHNEREESEGKSKADMKVLIKEVKSLRSSQSELKQELSSLMREKLGMERTIEREKKSAEIAKTANEKLLHECDILRNRLQECSVNFIFEEGNKLMVDSSPPSDAIDQLATSDNRIGLLVAEAQLLAEDVEKLMITTERMRETDTVVPRRDDEVGKMLTEVLIDNARLRKQMNAVVRCALAEHVTSDREGDEEGEGEPSISLGRTVLSKFLEK